MVKITPLIASMLIAMATALPQQGPSGTESFSLEMPTGTGAAFPSGTGSFGGQQGGFGGHPSGTGFGGPAPTGGFGGQGHAAVSGTGFPAGPKPTGGKKHP